MTETSLFCQATMTSGSLICSESRREMETSPDESRSLYVIAKPGNYFSQCFVFVMLIFPGQEKEGKETGARCASPGLLVRGSGFSNPRERSEM
jgi:hypothetical protein